MRWLGPVMLACGAIACAGPPAPAPRARRAEAAAPSAAADPREQGEDLGPPRLVPTVGRGWGALSLSPDGRLAAVAGEAEIRVFDLDRQLLVAVLDKPPDLGSPRPVRWTADGRWMIATGHRDVRLYEALGGTIVGTVRSDLPQSFRDLSILDGVSRLAFLEHGGVAVADVATGAVLWRAAFADASMLGLSPDGVAVAASSGDLTRTWDVRTGKPLARVKRNGYAFAGAGGEHIAVAFDTHIEVHHRGAVLWRASGCHAEPYWHPKRPVLAACGAVRDFETGRAARLPDGYDGATWDPAGVWLIGRVEGGKLVAFRPDTGEEKTLTVPSSAYNATFDPTSSYVHVQHREGFVELSWPEGKALLEVPIRSVTSCDVAFRPDGAFDVAACASDDPRAIDVWRRAGATLRHVQMNLGDPPAHARTTLDATGTRLFVNCGGDRSALWLAPGAPQPVVADPHDVLFGPRGDWMLLDGTSIDVRRLPGGTGFSHDGSPQISVADPTGRYLAIATQGPDGVVLLDTTSMRETAVLPQQATAIAWHPRAPVVALGFGATVELWQVDPPARTGSLRAADTVLGLEFDPEGQRLGVWTGESMSQRPNTSSYELWDPAAARRLWSIQHRSVLASPSFRRFLSLDMTFRGKLSRDVIGQAEVGTMASGSVDVKLAARGFVAATWLDEMTPLATVPPHDAAEDYDLAEGRVWVLGRGGSATARPFDERERRHGPEVRPYVVDNVKTPVVIDRRSDSAKLWVRGVVDAGRCRVLVHDEAGHWDGDALGLLSFRLGDDLRRARVVVGDGEPARPLHRPGLLWAFLAKDRR